ncbi:MAG: RluA family pseudouridine synthase [Phycisphaerales bacterium]
MPTPDLPIVHASDRFVVIDKPAGLLSVPGKGPHKADCAAARVRAIFPGATGPLVVHRLDMDTSGLMVFALDPGAQRDLSRQFEERTVEKAYTALLETIDLDLEGSPLARESGLVDAPMRVDVDNRPFQIHDPVHGRPAQTRWFALAREGDRTRVRFEPITGRAHQLRVHASLPPPLGLGAPILGDVLYNPTDHALAQELDEDPPRSPRGRLMLHATELSFLVPGAARRVDFRSPAPF